MKNTSFTGTISYIDEDNGFAILKTGFGNYVVDVTELRKAKIKWKSCLPDIKVEFNFVGGIPASLAPRDSKKEAPKDRGNSSPRAREI